MIGRDETKPITIAGCRFKVSALIITQPKMPAVKTRKNEAMGDLASQVRIGFITALYSKVVTDSSVSIASVKMKHAPQRTAVVGLTSLTGFSL